MLEVSLPFLARRVQEVRKTKAGLSTGGMTRGRNGKSCNFFMLLSRTISQSQISKRSTVLREVVALLSQCIQPEVLEVCAVDFLFYFLFQDFFFFTKEKRQLLKILNSENEWLLFLL